MPPKSNDTSGSSPKAASASKCLVPKCTGTSERRGVCRNCYAAFWRQVASKKITWKKLVNAGLILESNRGRVRSLAGRAVENIA